MRQKGGNEEINCAEISDSDVDQIEIQMDDEGVNDGGIPGTEPPPASEDRKAEEEFNRKLDALMNEDPAETKKKRKREQKSFRKWSKKRKIVTGAAVAAVALFVASKFLGGGDNQAPLAAVMPLAKGDIEQKLAINGPVSGTDSAEVVSNLHYEILEMKVKEGDSVKKDQVLAVLDSSEIQKQVDIAQNAYDLAVTTYREKTIEAENGYAKAQQDYRTAKDDYNRKTVLFQAGSVSSVELETAKNVLEEAARQLRTFNIKDGKAVANDSYALDIKSKAFELEQRKTDLENTQVKSPIDGTVVRVNCKVGRFADKTDDDKPMFIIDNLDVLEMKINVSEYSIGKIEVGQPVTISADILGEDTVAGEVVSISPTGEEKGGGSTERVIPTTVRILDQDTKLIAGITARAQIVLEESKDAWVVPISALIQLPDGGNSIAAVENNMVKMIPVEVGVEGDIDIQVIPKTEGTLTEGMEIATAPNAGFYDGMPVTPMPGV